MYGKGIIESKENNLAYEFIPAHREEGLEE
jgi:hypothetical protein